ncbi:hypothetical protein OsI_35758 [Oryza sativa Indica Group]|uniref:Uncharacterized protein n=1 Tax=Oryza sativa subsp. indica TaxID=39946 RepID=B8BK02_ORYSI|nr:hypothetical protein OsI_35758 [Oryza sativa Indica Group]
MGRKRKARVSRDGDGSGEEEQEEEEPAPAAVESKSLYEVNPQLQTLGSWLPRCCRLPLIEQLRVPFQCAKQLGQDYATDESKYEPLVVPLTPEEVEVEVETAGTGDDNKEEEEEEEEEYVSDPDDALLPEMRRREASGDRFQEESRGRCR